MQAVDQGDPQQRVTGTLMVEVLDANDLAPVFDQDTYTATVREVNRSQSRSY